jgi:hypothetical protein
MSWIITGTQKNNWTPADIDTALWLDAADASTITESGGAVSQWNDKSGNGRDVAQVTAVNQPEYVTGVLNGKPVVRFALVDKWLITTSSFGTATQRSVFSVNTYTAFSQYQYVWDQNGSPVEGASLVFRAGAATIDWLQNDTIAWADGYNSGRSPRFISSGVTGNGSAAIHGLALGNEESVLRVNGTSSAARVQLTAAWPNVARTFSVGKSTQSLRGDVAEIVYIDGPVPTTTRQKLEGYLAHKWGLTANLPANHPYKTAVPVP